MLYRKVLLPSTEFNIEMKDTQNNQQIVNSISGKTFVLTGTLSMKRSNVEDIIRKHGGHISNKIHRNVQYLLVGSKGVGTTKYNDAIKYRTKIISEKDLAKWIHP